MRVAPGRSVVVMSFMVMTVMLVTMRAMDMMRVSIVMALLAADSRCVGTMIMTMKGLALVG
jgi:hypothetical protein